MIKEFICKLFGIKQCACTEEKPLVLKDEVEQKGFPIINSVNRKLEKINRKHKNKKESE
jgi:hypothetical protein